MKKTIALVITLSMIVALTGCSSPTPSSSTPSSSTPPSATAEPGETIDYSYCVHSSTGVVDEAMDLFAKTLSELSNGRFVATAYTPGTMGTEAELVDAVLLGDLTFSTPADTLTFQALGLDDWESLPGLVTNYDEVNKYILSEDGYMSQLINKKFSEKGIVRLGAQDNGFRMVASKKPLNTPDVLRGLKMRTASAWAMVNFYQGVGAIPTSIDSSEVLTALEQGTVDAVENSLFNLANQGFIDKLGHVLAVNYIYSARSIVCNAEWFNKLSADDQKLVRQAAKVACDFANEENTKTYNKLLEDSRWTVSDATEEQIAVFEASAKKMWDEVSKTYDAEVMEVLLSHRN